MSGVYMHNLQLKFIWSYVKSEKGSKYKTSFYEYIPYVGQKLSPFSENKKSPFLELSLAY